MANLWEVVGPIGDRKDFDTEYTSAATAEKVGSFGSTYIAHGYFKTQIIAWRDHEFNDPILNVTVLYQETHGYAACDRAIFGDIDARFGSEQWLYAPDGRLLKSSGSGATNSIDGPFANRVVIPAIGPFSYYFNNKDIPIGDLDWLLAKDKTKTRIHVNIDSFIGGLPEGASDNQVKTFSYKYPPFKILPKIDPPPPPPPPSGETDVCGKDIISENGLVDVKISSTYKISKVGYTQSVSWTPNNTNGDYGKTVKNRVIIEKVGTFETNPPKSFNTPSPAASSYVAYAERYYEEFPSVLTRSNGIKLYTYSQPTLTGISLSKYTLSPRAGESLRITLNGMNNKTWGIENNFRIGIWSNIKAKYYIDETNTNSYRDLLVDNIKTMFPDTSAVNGVVNGVVKVNRRNLGVSGGNPGSGQLVYETDTRTQNITIKYTPTKPIDPNKEPNNDPSNSGLRYNKRENNIQGAKLTAGHTWVLPNTYNIGTMTGVDVTIQYPKTDDAGVLNGYRIRLISANDGSPHANETYYEHHYDTTDYTKTFTIPYDIIRRGISGNIIEITPYYKPSTGGYWYGPTITKKFVDIAWMLDDPIIDCPLTGTIWHNHQYRVLFKLPKDKDTNYKGKNDIEFYYGTGTYRYQEIQIDINGTITTLGNNAYMNAQNSWNSPVNINNAKLTYLRNIIINQSLIPTYKVDDYYFIKIRVRKAYGQNPNWDGWSNWSQPITVGRKTVSNTNVVRHETIMASHYMNVQNAFNKCTACYARTASNNQNFVVQESFDRKRGDNINGPHLSPPSNTPFKTIREYVSEFNDLHQLKNKINSYGTFDTDKNRSKVKLDYQNKLLATFVPSQEFITAEKDQNGATECDSPSTILKGRNYMKYMCDELNNLW